MLLSAFEVGSVAMLPGRPVAVPSRARGSLQLMLVGVPVARVPMARSEQLLSSKRGRQQV